MRPRRIRLRPAPRARRPRRCSSGPSAVIVIVVPRAAASSRMPMMLLPSISRPCRATRISRVERVAQVDELRRRAGVHAQLVDDGDGARGHSRACAAVFSPRRKSDATQIALRPCSRISCATASSPATPADIRELDQHRQVDAGDDLEPLRLEERHRRDWTGVPPNMSVSSSTPLLASHALDRLRDVLARAVHVVVPADRHGGELRQVADDHLRRVQQLVRELPVRDDDDADHAVYVTGGHAAPGRPRVRTC